MTCLAAAAQGCSSKADSGSVSAASPDGKYRAVLVEKTRPGMLDRNFSVVLESLADEKGSRAIVFESPDEGRPVGSERFLWTSDSRFVLLLGKQFFVANKQDVTSKGEIPYLLYNVLSGELKCNASQLTKYKRFSVEELSGMEWAGEKVAK
jgi:hypothetical protein